MKQFRISEKGYQIFKRQWLTDVFPILALFVAAAIITETLWRGKSIDSGPVFGIYFVLPVFAALFYWNYKKRKEILLSYSVTVSDDAITREVRRSQPLTIPFAAVSEVIHTAKGTLIIKGANPADSIIIPFWIDGFAELADRLQVLASVAKYKRYPPGEKYSPYIPTYLLVTIAVMTAATNRVLLTVCTTLVEGLVLWIISLIRRNKQAPKDARAMVWALLFLFVFIPCAFYLYLKGY